MKEYDQTDNTMPTLMAAQVFVERFIQPTVEYALHSFYRKRLKLLALVKRLYGRKVEKKMRQLELIDAQEFKKYRRYMIFLFRKNNSIKLIANDHDRTDNGNKTSYFPSE